MLLPMRWIAFLRGMNLGNRRITNPELCSAFSHLGLEDPTAFLASGNVVFETAEAGEAALARRIERGLDSTLGYPVPTFLRSADELRAIAEHRPFSEEEIRRSNGKPQILILREEPAVSAREAVLALASPDDRLSIEGRELYWLPSGGILESELDLDEIGKRLGLGTMRTHNTIARLTAKFLV
jgi:uncharacterized protein (DUF1697 family)